MPTDYKQYNYIANYPSDSSYSFAGYGCGPTSCADLLDISPLITAKWMEDHGFATYGSGTEWDGIQACLTAYGGNGRRINQNTLDGVTSSSYFTQWQNIIQNGYCGILLMHKVISSYWTNSGHFISIVGCKDGQYLVYDPASTARTGYHPWGDFVGNVSILYSSSIKWGGSSGTYYTFSPKKVYIGINSNSVLLLQKILCARGFYKKKFGLDGSFGQETYKALIAYQTARQGQLEIDGICGPKTWTDLLGMDSSSVQLDTVQQGSTGVQVLLLQEILMADGYYAGQLDRKFGAATQAGVRNYQQNNKLVVDGVCGANTWKSLIKL